MNLDKNQLRNPIVLKQSSYKNLFQKFLASSKRCVYGSLVKGRSVLLLSFIQTEVLHVEKNAKKIPLAVPF